MTTDIIVAGVAITPPDFKASGGVSAGVQLMRRVADRVQTHMLMMSRTENSIREGSLSLHHIRATNLLGASPGPFPRALHTMMWRADFGRWFDQLRPDVVHFHNPHPAGALVAATREARRRGIPYIISTHGYVEFDDYARASQAAAWKRPLIDLLVRRPVVQASRGAARMAMLSPEERSILNGMGVPDERLEVVPNGVDPFFAEPFPEAERANLVAGFGLPEDRPIIFFVGNHTPNKGIDVLLAAATAMREPAVIVIGGGIRSAAEHQAMLAAAGGDSLLERVIFTDFLDRNQLKALYQTCDIFAFPSRADTLPLVILEAMASGKPVVSTRVGGIPFEVSDDTGVLVEPGDADALARALDRLAADPMLRASMGSAGRRRALEIFNWDRSADCSVAIYREILAAPRN